MLFTNLEIFNSNSLNEKLWEKDSQFLPSRIYSMCEWRLILKKIRGKVASIDSSRRNITGWNTRWPWMGSFSGRSSSGESKPGTRWMKVHVARVFHGIRKEERDELWWSALENTGRCIGCVYTSEIIFKFPPLTLRRRSINPFDLYCAPLTNEFK